ncbi:uncharacterized protein [Halyomorpha halys]|uniref:uncharacterized protein n=1 Tax=Halyomorpha halys TaxID=286706 RepID=UPI0006D4D0B2|nr:uncharacterized protein LOC106681186 [Halyomorpha halys]
MAMAVIDSLLVILLTIWLVEKGAAYHHKGQHISVRTPAFDKEKEDAFYSLPDHISDEGIENFEKVCFEDDFPYTGYNLYCLCDDPRLCLIFDEEGYLVGIQISYPRCELLDDYIYNSSNTNYISTYIFGVELISVRIWFINPECGRNSKPGEMVDGLWVVLNGQLVRIDSKCQPNAPNIGEFVMLGCADQIGQVFAYQFDDHHSLINGFFLYLLYEDRRLVGWGHTMPGKISQGPHLNVYSYPDGPLIDTLVKYPPPQFHDLQSYGFTTTVVYLIKDPWNIRCPKCLCD